MSTVITSQYSSATATVLAGILPFPPPQPVSEVSLQIVVPDFHLRLGFPLKYLDLVDLTLDIQSGKVIFTTAVEEDVSLVFTLTGELIEGGAKFRSQEASLNIELAAERAQANFVASTLWAMFGLAGQVRVQMPEVELDLNFALPLLEISQMLQRRQAAYRLMVIERATDRQFFLPEHFSGEDLSAITETYRAIVDRSYIGHDHIIPLSVAANQDGLAWLAEHDQPTRYQFGPEPVDKILFGQSIPLGHGMAVIEDGIILEIDRVRAELARGDGHLVEVPMRSLSGQVRYEFPEAPHLPDTPWPERIQALIDLESQLDTRHAEAYHALAAATLAGLTEEEKKEITARPKFSEEASLTND